MGTLNHTILKLPYNMNWNAARKFNRAFSFPIESLHKDSICQMLNYLSLQDYSEDISLKHTYCI